MAILKLAVATLCLMLMACQRDPTIVELSDRNIVVHALLVGGDDSARVLVTRPATATLFDAPIGLRGAHVTLNTPTQTIIFTQSGSCFSVNAVPGEDIHTNDGCYTAAVPGGIVYGASYDLEIVVPGRPIIRGSTVVPAQPVIHSPSPNIEVSYSTEAAVGGPAVQFEWTVSDDDAPVTLHLEGTASNCQFGFRGESLGLLPHFALRGSVSLLAEPLLWNCAEPPARVPAQFVITAFDDNYDVYLRNFDESISAEAASIGLSGAFGLFASAARTAIPVELVRR
jgi:hypothetical protein